MSRVAVALLLLSGVVTAGSGAAYAWMRYMMTPEDPFTAYGHPWQPSALDLHLLAAPLLLLVIGWIWGAHRRRDPEARRTADSKASRRRVTGWVLMASVAVMTASGALLQTTATEGLHGILAWTHGISGAWFLLLASTHRSRAVRGI